MRLDKKALERIVLFVKAVKNEHGSEEFIAQLREVLDAKAPKIDAIEKYLGLDYSIDSEIPNIDYSFVTDRCVRNQLEADYREMLRYRYGLRAHRIDIMEFCRYVQLQAEMILNYYYTNRFDDEEEIILHISQYITWIEIKEISYYVLLVGFCKEHNLDWKMLDGVREIRNIQSHRSALKMDISEAVNKARIFAETNKVWFDKKKNTLQKSKDEAINTSFENEFGVDIKTYNSLAIQYYFDSNKPFNDIINSLYNIVNCISRLI